MKRLPLTVFLVVIMLTGCTHTPTPSAANPRSGQDSVEFAVPRHWRYLVQLPKGYEQNNHAWPLVIFLHGSGERGDDVQKVATHGPAKLAAQGREFPFILVAPQCPAGLLWSGPEVDEFVAQMMKRYRVDAKRVYLTGLSMGGYGVWEAAIYNPGRYAALVPICGGGYCPELGARLKDIPIRAFHGAKDDVVPLAEARSYVDAVNAAGGHAELTVYPDAGHDAWTETYANPALYDWLLSQKRP